MIMLSTPIIYYSSVPVNIPKLVQFGENYLLPTQAGFVPYPGILYTVMEQERFQAFFIYYSSLF